MNNNNLYNNNTFIGTTHQDYFKISSNALSTQINITSNILEQHLNYTSNILDIKASNFTTTTSNLILARYDKLIKEENEDILLPVPTTLKHTYIYNNNNVGEIRFQNKGYIAVPLQYPIGTPNYKAKIDFDGMLKLYWVYDPLISVTFFGGWKEPISLIAGLTADSINQGGLIAGLETQITVNKTYNDRQIEALWATIIATEEGTPVSSVREEILQWGSPGTPATPSTPAIPPSPINNANAALTLQQRAIQWRQRLGNTNISTISRITQEATNYILANPGISFALGTGFTIAGIAYGILQSADSYNYFTGAIENSINSNTYLSSTVRKSLSDYNQSNIAATNLIDMTIGYYNLAKAQGFINTNITTQQYISNLKCDNLYLNNGNVSGINYVNVNNIVADGRIKENNKFLDTTYLTSNHIYNLAYNYTAERQYPSKLYNSISQEDTVSLIDKSVYHQILYLDNQSIAYGSGFYEIYSSSSYDTPTTKNKLFNYDTTETTTSSRWAINQYNSGTGNYQSANYIKNDYYGDWIIIKLPQSIMLTRYRIYQRSDFLTKAPAEWKVYGSNDGITFTEITEASQTTRLSSYTSGFYEKTLATTFTTQYQYIGFVFNKLLSTSGQTDLSFAELQIFGKEIISNSIVSNIYTTSNICKNLIIYDTPEVCKHFAFYILITTPININGNTYYKYDIDLSQYTKKGYIQIGSGSNDPYRIFKIRAFYASSYFGTLIDGLPDVVYADIFMSFKAAGSGLGQAGLNVCSIGNISNPSLTSVPPNNLFFMRNGANSIDYITVVSKSTADVRVIIEDLLG